MKKAIIVEYNFMTRIIIDESQENTEDIVRLSKQKIQDKLDNDELGDNLSEWYDDHEHPYEEEMIPVLFHTIKNNIGWGKWCDITGGNHYALNEGYSPNDTELFYCTKTQAERLGIL